jgi:hypothetical protein
VSQPARVPRGLESLIRTVAGGADEEERDRRASTFARGLALGALVGAAIAGSTIWQRRQARPPQPAPSAGATPDPDAPETEPQSPSEPAEGSTSDITG